MSDDQDDSASQGSPRYVDETMDADPNLRPDLEATEERGTDQAPDLENAEEKAE